MASPSPDPGTPVSHGAESGPSGLSAGEADEPEPGYTVSAVAHRLGVAPSTLRTWDRRYGVSPSQRTAGSHRRYTAFDIALLERMRSHIAQGMPPGDAARSAMAESAATAPEVVGPPQTTDHPRGSPGGGRVLKMPGGSDAQRGLARATLALDGQTIATLLEGYLSQRGVVWTWEEVVLPVVHSLGDKVANSGRGIESEHLLSNTLVSLLGARAQQVTDPVNPRPVLLSCVDEEQHTLPLFAVAAGLAEQRVQTRVLGARVPPHVLASSARRIGPVAVLLWAQRPTTAESIEAVPSMRPQPLVTVGGPGWPRDLPAHVTRLSSLQDAVARLAAASNP